MKRFVILFFIGLLALKGFGQDKFFFTSGDIDPVYEQLKAHWVDSVYNKMTLDERLGQLFMVAAYSNKDEAHLNSLISLVEKEKIGGLIFFQGGPIRQAKMTNVLQAKAKLPLWIAMDAEWGLGMRLDSTINFPRQLTLGAMRQNDRIYEMGREIARQTRRLGMHINFAPVVDVNNNPKNPVINNRSFGEDKNNVALKGLAYAEGLQDGNVMACAKHFPGHGDTGSDSHLTLPVISHDRKRLEDLELHPFRILINNGVQSIMAAHIHVPALDSTFNLATSLSPKVTTQLLKKEMGFDGLVFSDALNMKGVSKFYEPGEVDLKAFLAGNDVLLFAEDVPRAKKLFKEALKNGKLTEARVKESVVKILEAKFDLGLTKRQSVEIDGLYKDLNTPFGNFLIQDLYEKSLVLAANNKSIPIHTKDSFNLASLLIGTTEKNAFQNQLSAFAPVEHFQSGKSPSQSLLNKLGKYETVIVGLFDMSKYSSRNYGITTETLEFLKQLNQQTNVVLSVFGSPYSLKYFENIPTVLLAHDEMEGAQKAAAQAIFGAIPISGKMPLTASEKFPLGFGIEQEQITRLHYASPEALGYASEQFEIIDSFVLEGIRDKAMPGCQVLVAKDGQIIWDKAYGDFDYKSNQKVKTSDIYDLASMTKVAATTLALMKLYEERKIQINRRMGDYLPIPDTSKVYNLIVKDVLTHSSGLQSWIPFYLKTIKDTLYDHIYSASKDSVFTIPVADNLYMRACYRDSIYNWIFNAKVADKPEYRYSDLGFYMFKLIVETQTGKDFETYLNDVFYTSLGLQNTCFNPLNCFDKERIVPTEDDKLFRKQLICGYVHDPGAAMLGGVGGHAGLFSNAEDMAVLLQMLLNGGEYGGNRYLESKTIHYFTRKQKKDNRRGLGFDKPEPDIYEPGPTAMSASSRSFGHSGFTGTCFWADPDHNLIYIFLSNRVNPDASNKKLIRDNIRTNIHQSIYDILKVSSTEVEN